MFDQSFLHPFEGKYRSTSVLLVDFWVKFETRTQLKPQMTPRVEIISRFAVVFPRNASNRRYFCTKYRQFPPICGFREKISAKISIRDFHVRNALAKVLYAYCLPANLIADESSAMLWAKLDSWLVREASEDILAYNDSQTDNCAFCAGTKLPIWAKYTICPICRMNTLFPDEFGPVSTVKLFCFAVDSWNPLLTPVSVVIGAKSLAPIMMSLGTYWSTSFSLSRFLPPKRKKLYSKLS